jgi:SAM-dependent methyltransferase/uncharacterized protein YbaR (Trm112 family)
MRYRLLDLVHCPKCAGEFDVTVHSESPEQHEAPSWIEDTERYEKDIREGSLACKNCGWLFPVVDGVPRLYLNAWGDFPGWRRRAKAELARAKVHKVNELKGVRRSRKSFGQEWSQHKKGEATWVWKIEQRLTVFEEEVGIGRDSIGKSVILDAGCGNGELTNALTEWGVEAVGMDLSNSVGRAEQNRTSSFVHYVQGDLLNPPLKPDSIDLIYSSGVLHHTPNPRGAFRNLVKCLHSDGRIYIWLYGTPEYEKLQAYSEDRARNQRFKPLIVPLPTWLQTIVLYPFAFRMWVQNHRKGPHFDVTMRQAMVAAFDWLTPAYRSHHHLEEIREWYADEGLSGVTMSNVRKPGFGVYGDKIKKSSATSSEDERPGS